MNIYNLVQETSANQVAKEFVDKYLKPEGNISESLAVFINFLVNLVTNNDMNLTKYDVFLTETLDIKEIFKNVLPENIECLTESEEFDEFIISMTIYMSLKKNDIKIYQKFFKKVEIFFKLMQRSELKGMLDLSILFSITFIKTTFNNFCTINDENDPWLSICGEFISLAYNGFASPYFGYDALDRICHVHEKTLKIFKYDPDFFINFIQGLQFKNHQMSSRIINSIMSILLNTNFNKNDIHIFKRKIIENIDFIFTIFLQNENLKIIRLYIKLFENLKLKLTEHQNFNLFKKIIKSDIIKSVELGLFFINLMKIHLSDKEIFFYILSCIKKTENKKNLFNIVEITWNNLPFIRNIDSLLFYFAKFQNKDQLASLAWFTVSFVNFLIQNNNEEFKFLLRFIPGIIKSQKEKSHFNIVNILLEIVNNINLQYFAFNNLGNDLYFNNLLNEIFSICEINEFFDNQFENELFIRKIFAIINKFYSFDIVKNEISNFSKKILKEFLEIIQKIKINVINDELLYKKLFILSAQISEAILHDFGIENIDFDNLIVLFSKEFKTGQLYFDISSKYNKYNILAYNIKSYCDCICLLEKSDENNILINEGTNSILNILCGNLIQFIFKINASVKDVHLIVKSIYALVKLVSLLHKFIDKLDSKRITVYYEQTINLISKFISNKNNIFGTEQLQIDNGKKIILELTLEMHKTCSPMSTVLWKLLRFAGLEHEYKQEWNNLINYLLENYNDNFVNIYAALIYNTNCNVIKSVNLLAVSNIREMYKNKYPLKFGTSSTDIVYLHIDAATILTLMEIIYDNIILNLEPNQQKSLLSRQNSLKCLDFIDDSFFEFFKKYSEQKNILFQQISKINSNCIHILNAEEKITFKNFNKKMKNYFNCN